MSVSSLLDIIVGKNGSVALQASQKHMEYVNSWLLMSSPMTPAIILATYLMFVLKIGPNYMKDRKPYNFPNVITFYNIVQIFISLFLVYTFASIHIKNGLIPKTCAMETESNRYSIASGMHYYLLAKASELLDTIFFVLRKKDKQLSFLHIYHHTLMIIVTWTALKYEPTIHLLVLGLVNSFVHVIMYTYYGLSSFPSLTKYLWWKKYITGLQLVQFVIVLTLFAAAAVYSECKPSYVLTTALSSNGFLFLYLFGKFYLKNYTKKNSKSAINDERKINTHISLNVCANDVNDKFEQDKNNKINGIKNEIKPNGNIQAQNIKNMHVNQTKIIKQA